MARYCEVEELSKLGIRAEALRSIPEDDQLSTIEAISDEIDGYLGARYTLPLLSWGLDLRKACARLTVCELLRVRGCNTSHPNDEELFRDGDAKIRWLKMIAEGDLAIRVKDSSGSGTVGHVSGGVQVASSPTRGYTTERYGSRLPFTGGRR